VSFFWEKQESYIWNLWSCSLELREPRAGNLYSSLLFLLLVPTYSYYYMQINSCFQVANLLLLLNADQFLLPGSVKWSNEPRDRCYRATNWNHTFHWQLRHMKIFSSSLARSYFYSSLHGDLCFYCFYKYFVWRAHRTPIDEFIFCQRWSQVSFFYIQSSTKSGMLGNLNTRYYKLFLLPQVLNSLF
jgi:hypothetical protein